MSPHSMLLHLASLLRQRYVHPAGFNSFTTLRGANDEVRLHLRFIATLLDPKAHNLGSAAIQKLLSQCSISGFSLEGLKIECERQHIAIMVANTRDQTLFIENKLEAGDQPKQLVRYYWRLQAIGYHEVHAYYLSLDGGGPDPDQPRGSHACR